MTTNKDLKEQVVNVHISQADIDNAKGKCPIWSFFEKSFPDFKVSVLRSSVGVFPKRGNKGLYGKLPYVAVGFTHDFDFSLPVEPISFYVSLKKG